MLLKRKNDNFINNNIWFILIGALLCIFGEYGNGFFVLAFLCFLFAIAFSPLKYKLCWSVFLVPNIRIFDSLGPTMLVNILMVTPMIFYFISKFLKRDFDIMGFPLVGAFLLFVVESLHMERVGEDMTPVIAWALTFAWCCYATLDKNMKIKKKDIVYALAAGIIFSAVVYLINNPWFTSDIINNVLRGYRFEAYGSDPNYYSLYICLILSCLVIKTKIKTIDYIIMIALVCIGFLTASKMCLILMIVNLVYLVIGTSNNLSKVLRNFFIVLAVICLLLIFKEYIFVFWDNLLNRSGGNNMTMHTLTSGRTTLFMDYINILSKDFSTLFFGKGFAYHTKFPGVVTHGSHNTYLDFILSWGIVGTAFLYAMLKIWFNIYKRKVKAITGYTLISKFPIVMLLLNFADLSCFSAGMFYIVITVALIQLKPKRAIMKYRKADKKNITKITQKNTVIKSKKRKPVDEKSHKHKRKGRTEEGMAQKHKLKCGR